jgi:hypothetical protein
MKLFTLLLLLLHTVCVLSQNDKPGREPFELNLAVDNEQSYKMQVGASPYFVKEKILQIYPGEKIYIEAEIIGEMISSMKTVKQNLNPEKTIEVSFEQKTENGMPQQMLLTINNPFGKSLNYNAAMYLVGHDRWIDTTIIPIRAGLTNFEMWPDVIITLVLHEWRLE